MTPHSKDERYSYVFLGNSYAEVNQHWIVVHSTPAKERAKKSVSRKLEKLVDKEIKAFNSLKSTMFACIDDNGLNFLDNSQPSFISILIPKSCHIFYKIKINIHRF